MKTELVVYEPGRPIAVTMTEHEAGTLGGVDLDSPCPHIKSAK